MKNKPKILKSDKKYSGKWLEFENLEYIDAFGHNRSWEYVKRTQNRGAVVVISKLWPSNKVVLVKQYRPPINKYIYEFPAGLIDEGETAEQTAVREFYEETGYTGIVKQITVPVYNTPGLTDETVAVAFMDIYEKFTENINAKPKHEPTEDIEVVRVDINDLLKFVMDAEKDGYAVDAKLMSFALAKNFF